MNQQAMVDVYYIGRKKNGRSDSVMHHAHRFWPEFGSKIAVPQSEAPHYLRFADVWTDKDGYLKAREARRTEDAATEKRQAKATKAAQPEPPKIEGPPQEADERDTMVQAAILSLVPGKAEDYTKSGKPRLARVVHLVGTNVSPSEITDAMNALRAAGKLSADPAADAEAAALAEAGVEA